MRACVCVQAPRALGGWYAELAGPRSLKFQMELWFEVVQPAPYTLVLSAGQRGKSGVYCAGQHEREPVIKFRVGEIDEDTGRFRVQTFMNQQLGLPVEYIAFACNGLRDSLFDQSQWPMREEEAPEEEEEGEDAARDEMMMGGGARGRYIFEVVDHQLCVHEERNRNREEGEVNVTVCNFWIPRAIETQQFIDDSHEKPLYKILARQRLAHGPDDGDVYYLSEEDTLRKPCLKQYSYLDVEVTLNICDMKTPDNVYTTFAKAHSDLRCSSFTPEMLRCYMLTLDRCPTTGVITRWGKQVEGTWVFANIAHKNGELLDLKDAGFGYSVSYFNNNPVLPMNRANFPRLVIIPFPHVRYQIGVNMWHNLMPAIFINNELPAKATFAATVLGLHADRLWKGESGLFKGMPVTWLYSKHHGTGKTAASYLGQAIAGRWSEPLMAGDASKPITAEKLSSMQNLTLFIDDYVPPKEKGVATSRVLSQESRMFYEGAARCVSGKIRQIRSGVVFSANSTVNDEDNAMQSRLLTIIFSELKCTSADTDAQLMQEFNIACELMSALQVDLAQIGLYEGKLDGEAIKDWESFLGAVLGRRRDRNVAEWAKLSYILSLLSMAFQDTDVELERMFDWILTQTTRSIFILNANPGLLDQFLIAIIECRETLQPDVLKSKPSDCLFWHNMRTNTRPAAYNGHWMAFRLLEVCKVIQNLTGKVFKHTEILEECKGVDGWHSGSSHFYDLVSKQMPWPISKEQEPEDGVMPSGLRLLAPLTEDELVAETLTSQRCLYIKKEFYTQKRQELEKSSMPEVDYKQVVIQSANARQADYNFFEAVTNKSDGGWFGWRSLMQGNFAPFCGADNYLFVGSRHSPVRTKPRVEALCIEAGYGSVAETFAPGRLREFFGYEMPTADGLHALPPSYRLIPFVARNERDDVWLSDPIPEEEGSQEPPTWGELLEEPSPKRAKNGGSSFTPPSCSSQTPLRECDGNSPAKSAASPAKEHRAPLARRTRPRASPSNTARYPRPPANVTNTETAAQWVAYARATGRVRSIAVSDEDEVRTITQSTFIYVQLLYLTLSCHLYSHMCFAVFVHRRWTTRARITLTVMPTSTPRTWRPRRSWTTRPSRRTPRCGRCRLARRPPFMLTMWARASAAATSAARPACATSARVAPRSRELVWSDDALRHLHREGKLLADQMSEAILIKWKLIGSLEVDHSRCYYAGGGGGGQLADIDFDVCAGGGL